MVLRTFIVLSSFGHVRLIMSLNDAATLDAVKIAGSPLNLAKSWSLCDGPCCEPLQRNRTCAFGNLIFSPPSSFLYISDDPSTVDNTTWCAYLNNRFHGGLNTTKEAHSLWAPQAAPLLAAKGITRVIESPVFLGAYLYSNPGHNMLDAVYPSLVSLLRLRAAASASGAQHVLEALPEPHENFTYLIYDESWYRRKKILHNQFLPYHRNTKEREFVETIAGRCIDLEELTRLCPYPGCRLRTLFAGVGHQGMSMVTERNIFGGAQVYRSLFAYRKRILDRYHVHSPRLLSVAHRESKRPFILFIETKRLVTNYQEVAASVARNSNARTAVIKWDGMSFKEQLELISKTDVHVTGVGTGQMNVFLLPPGAVALGLGWRDDFSYNHIHYFDAILASLDHVSVLYYPSYGPEELEGTRAVTLNVSKATSMVLAALQRFRKGFNIPIPFEENANDYDRAYSYLFDLSNGLSHMKRTGDEPWPVPLGGSCVINNPESLLFHKSCGWRHHIPEVLERYPIGPAECRPPIAMAMCVNGTSRKKAPSSREQGKS
jgi:hypothetical protein